MFIELAGLHDVDLRASTHVGDSERDRDAAASAGVGIFVWARDFFGWTPPLLGNSEAVHLGEQ